MKCENCGTENNFEWATNCMGCNLPLPPNENAAAAQEPNALDSAESTRKVTSPQPSAGEEAATIETGIADPLDFVMGKEIEDPTLPQVGSIESIKPEPIADELTLYRDQDVKVSLSESDVNPAVILESLKDKLKITAEIDAPPQSSDDIALETNADLISYEPPEADQSGASHPVIEPAKKSQEAHTSTTKVMAVDTHSEPDSPKFETNRPALAEIEIPVLSELKQSKGVIYLSGKNLKLSGGMKIRTGEEIVINDKSYEVKKQPGRSSLFYAGIGASAAFIFLIVLIIVNLSSKGNGQVAGMITSIADGRPVTGITLSVSELGKTATTNQAGFFVFDQMPSGIYTVEYRASDGTMMKDKISVVENRTSTVTLKDGTPHVREFVREIEPEKPARPARTENEVTKSGKGTLKLTLEPNNASVFLDDKPIGVGSNSYKVAAGSYELLVKKAGYGDKSQSVRIDSDRTTSVTITLKEATTVQQSRKTYGEIARENELAGNYREALRNYEKVLANNPRDVSAVLGKARCYRQQGMSDNALTYYLQAAKLAGDKGDTESQIAALTGVTELKPTTFTAYASRGELLYELGQYEKAIDDFSKVIEFDNRNLSAYYKLGNCFYKTKNYKEALNTFMAAQDLNFADPKAEAYMAKTYLAMGDKKNCKKAYERFKDLANYSTRLEFKKDPEWQKVLAAVGETE